MAYELQPGQDPEDIVRQMMGLSGPMGGLGMLVPGDMLRRLGFMAKNMARPAPRMPVPSTTGSNTFPMSKLMAGQLRGGSSLPGRVPTGKDPVADEELLKYLVGVMTRMTRN